MFIKNKSDKHSLPASGSITISYNFMSISFLILIIVICIIRSVDYKFDLEITLPEYISMCSFGCVTIGLLYNASLGHPSILRMDGIHWQQTAENLLEGRTYIPACQGGDRFFPQEKIRGG